QKVPPTTSVGNSASFMRYQIMTSHLVMISIIYRQFIEQVGKIVN
ncbi:MAG: hypothetical protein ACI8P9_002951, partial [Parasphingorhabdus sp.]